MPYIDGLKTSSIHVNLVIHEPELNGMCPCRTIGPSTTRRCPSMKLVVPVLGQYLRADDNNFSSKDEPPKLCCITDFSVERIFFSPTTISIVKDPKKNALR
jgi:hypothetical protein